MVSRLLVHVCTLFLVSWVGAPLLWSRPQVMNVRERIKALQSHWPNRESRTRVLYRWLEITGGALCIAGAAYLYCRKRAEWKRRKAEREFRERARSAGFTERELNLLRLIVPAGHDVDPRRLLFSLRSFDEVSGEYLCRFCAVKPNPLPLIRALRGIRAKIEGVRRASAGRVPPRKGAVGAAFDGDVVDMDDVPLLSVVEVWNLTASTRDRVMGCLVGKKGRRLRVVGMGKKLQRSWQRGDQLRLRLVPREGEWVELLLRFLRLESAGPGLFLAEWEFGNPAVAGGMGGLIRLQRPITVYRTHRRPESGRLEWMNLEEAFILNPRPCAAGEKIQIAMGLEEYGIQERVSARVVYCRVEPRMAPGVGLRFLGKVMKEDLEYMTLTPAMQRLFSGK